MEVVSKGTERKKLNVDNNLGVLIVYSQRYIGIDDDHGLQIDGYLFFYSFNFVSCREENYSNQP